MRVLAARVGVTPMALYRHFKGREALLESVVEQGHAIFLHYLQQALAEPTPAARLARSGQQYLDFALAHPSDYAVMFMKPLGSKRRHAPPWRDVATFRFLVDRVRECADAGALRVDDPEGAALMLWAHVHGLTSLYLAGKLRLDEAAFRALYARSVTRLMGAFGWRRRSPAAERAAARR